MMKNWKNKKAQEITEQEEDNAKVIIWKTREIFNIGLDERTLKAFVSSQSEANPRITEQSALSSLKAFVSSQGFLC